MPIKCLDATRKTYVEKRTKSFANYFFSEENVLVKVYFFRFVSNIIYLECQDGHAAVISFTCDTFQLTRFFLRK